jgi:hypothetical protein
MCSLEVVNKLLSDPKNTSPLGINLSIYLPIYLSINLSINLSIYLFIYLPINLFISLSIAETNKFHKFLSIYISMHISI